MPTDDKALIKFATVISRETLSFSQAQRAEAEETRTRQPEIWRQFLQIFRPFMPHLEQAWDRFSAIVVELAEANSPSIDVHSEGYNLSSNFPMLVADELERFNGLIKRRPWACVGAIIHKLRFRVWARTDEIQSELVARMFSDPRILGAMMDFQIDVAGDERTAEVIRKAESATNDAAKVIADIEENGKAALIRINDEAENRRLLSEKFLSEAKLEIEAARKQATDYTILKGAVELWTNKANSHQLRFMVGFAALAVLVFAVILVVVFCNEWLLKHYGITSPTPSYPSIALLIFSLLAIGWLARFIGRFVVDNMVMEADSQQRRVMLETYLALIGNKDAQMVEQTDRVLILNAIFRPLPGHQSEDISPPSVADLLKTASAKP